MTGEDQLALTYSQRYSAVLQPLAHRLEGASHDALAQFVYTVFEGHVRSSSSVVSNEKDTSHGPLLLSTLIRNSTG